MDAKSLLVAVRTAQGIPSNYRLARLLGVPDKTVQRWNTGQNTPDDAMAAELAKMAGLDPDAVVADMHAQRAASDPERERWHRIARRLEGAGAAAALAFLALFVGGGPDAGAQAAQLSAPPAASAAPLCIMSSRLRRLLALFWRDFLTGFPVAPQAAA